MLNLEKPQVSSISKFQKILEYNKRYRKGKGGRERSR